jgi:hypothetical protein
MKTRREITVNSIQIRIESEKGKHGKRLPDEWSKIAASKIYSETVLPRDLYIDYLVEKLKSAEVDFKGFSSFRDEQMKENSSVRPVRSVS